jgi:hypothetical protein
MVNQIVIPTTSEAVSLRFRPYHTAKSEKLLGYLEVTVKSMMGSVLTSFPVFTWQDPKSQAKRYGVIGKLDYKVGTKEHSHGFLSRDLKAYINRILEENSSMLTGESSEFVETHEEHVPAQQASAESTPDGESERTA